MVRNGLWVVGVPEPTTDSSKERLKTKIEKNEPYCQMADFKSHTVTENLRLF